VSSDTLGSYFLAGAARYPQRQLVRQPDRVRTYAEIAVAVASTVEQLRARGIVRGDYVACYLEDQVPNLIFELACALSGVIAVPLSPLFSVDYFLQGIVRRVDAKAVLTNAAGAAALAGHGVHLFAYPDPNAAAPLKGAEMFEPRSMHGEQAIQSLRASAAGIGGDDVFMVQPTSGSTGTPKLVVRLHRAFTRYAHFVGDQLVIPESGEPAGFLTAATLTHAFGLHMLTTALKRAGTLCIPSNLDTAASLAEIRALDPAVLPILPRMQRALLRQHERDYPGEERIFGPGARYICSAGGVADPAILERISKTGVEIIEFYGSSEASVVAITQRGRWRAGWSGMVAPDADVRVNEDGELTVRSPGVMQGYFGDPEATAAVTDAEGRYLTGDQGEVTADRQLRILGRKRDVFNTPEGSNIYPGPIEQQLESLPLIEAAVLVDDQRPFLVALLVVQSTPSQEGDAKILYPAAHASLYQQIGLALSELNAKLERVEQIVRFAVLSGPFATEAYRVVGPGKIRRDRVAVRKIYADVISYLFGSAPNLDASFVPGIERRLRPTERP